MSKNWFEVSKEGLSKALARRGVAFAVGELLQNAMDADNVTLIRVALTPTPHAPTARLVVEDDSPAGFVDLRHAWVLFGGSTKLNDPTRSGKYDLGDKLVFAISREAAVQTTTGSVRFDATGRHRSADKRDRGSRVEALLPMTRTDLDRCVEFVDRVLPRPGMQIEFTAPDGTVRQIAHRTPIATAKATLETEVGDELGRLQRVYRATTIDVHRVPAGDKGILYELGLPVYETGDAFSYNVNQRVPVGWDRDAVSPWYLGCIRTAALGVVADYVEDPNAEWVNAALERSDVAPEAVRTIIGKRFGPLAVAADPTDLEAVATATSRGYTVVAGGSLSGPAWNNVRKADALPRAGRVFPSARTSAPPDAIVQPGDYTPGMQRVARYLQRLGPELINCEPSIVIALHANGANQAQWHDDTKTILFNLDRLPDGDAWFGTGTSVPDDVIELVLHEFGHASHDGRPAVSNHLSREYEENLCRLGARMRHLGHLDWEN